MEVTDLRQTAIDSLSCRLAGGIDVTAMDRQFKEDLAPDSSIRVRHPLFHPSLNLLKTQTEHPVDGRRRQVQRKRLESGGDELLGCQHQFGHCYYRHQRCVLDEADQAIGQARYRGPQRLWPHDVAQRLIAGSPRFQCNK